MPSTIIKTDRVQCPDCLKLFKDRNPDSNVEPAPLEYWEISPGLEGVSLRWYQCGHIYLIENYKGKLLTKVEEG